MTDTPQQAIVTVLSKLIDAAPQIIAAAAAAWVVIWRTNKKTDEKGNETNVIVENKTAATMETSTTNAGLLAAKLDSVHDTVNGNLSVEKARGDALAIENESLKSQLKRRASKKKMNP